MSKLEEQYIEFIKLTVTLGPSELIGLARMLCVEISTEELDEKGLHLPRPFEEVYGDMLEAFSQKNRQERRQIIRLLREAQ